MKKSLVVLSMVGIFVLGSTQLAFAEGTQGKGLGIKKLMEQGLTFDEAKAKRLELRYAKVDEAVTKGTITEERAVEIKADMKANVDKCTTPEEFKNTKENYGLKLAKGEGKRKTQEENDNIVSTNN